MATTETTKSKRSPLGFLTIVLVFTIVLVMLIVSYYSFLFCIIAMLPAASAAFSGQSAYSKYTTYVVYAFNFIGVAPHASNLFHNLEQLDDTARTLIYDPCVWISVYGCTLIGFTIAWMVPQVTAVLFVSYSVKEVERLQKQQINLLEEWGPEVATRYAKR